MKKIILFCGGGFSSSLLVLKIREAALASNYECFVEAYAASNPLHAKDADVVLLGPQIRFHLKKFEEALTCPVTVMDTVAYGTMNGTKILAQARQMMKDE